jgi:hypothetical protein
MEMIIKNKVYKKTFTWGEKEIEENALNYHSKIYIMVRLNLITNTLAVLMSLLENIVTSREQ